MQLTTYKYQLGSLAQPTDHRKCTASRVCLKFCKLAQWRQLSPTTGCQDISMYNEVDLHSYLTICAHHAIFSVVSRLLKLRKKA